MSATTRTLEPWLRRYADAFIRVLEAAGVRVTVTSTYRSIEKQKQLYEAFLRGRTVYPVAKPGNSMHNYGRAFDLQLDPPVYREAGVLWERMGGTWGGRFRDQIHFEA